ncbi:ABC transporter ATP-binding protein [Ulvibacterium marinum]|uniref:ABC transporter ATP-binding protein n=1 Tax=Ulvibacterium marinum TaxID=2419782 RepID=A0A3B0BXF8_9FLAO|nr:ABC transporter ATP-binding protein [Ulvibacterium marinum]RKN76749.1 ABC transporter ATP-binding protein [Ulvibacterium marinum]
MDKRNAIEVEGLTKRFGDFTAVDAISFQVAKGEIFGFLGANGAGKTTAMKMLIGLSRPTEGMGKVAGFDIDKEAEQVKRNIGYMSQKFSLYDDLTPKENVRFYGGVYGLSKNRIKEKTREILKELHLEEVANKPVVALPLGWKQRLAFAISMVHDPDIVFLDEPTGGVDPYVRRQFWETIYQVAEQGRTIFVTTHYMDEAEYCDRVSIMVTGKIEALDTPEKLKEEYNANTMDEVFLKLVRY